MYKNCNNNIKEELLFHYFYERYFSIQRTNQKKKRKTIFILLTGVFNFYNIVASLKLFVISIFGMGWKGAFSRRSQGVIDQNSTKESLDQFQNPHIITSQHHPQKSTSSQTKQKQKNKPEYWEQISFHFILFTLLVSFLFFCAGCSVGL